ncbi:unnamed protein product [Paramecium sonneborni]|uniref:Guanylate cyclase domain-containing protein n=1 Tax=Paramecium sonneborni TaxID=65129 RepID=A0A8S1RAY9_9CILI|nr:unnamed protein product [Paramecium sonneborni]
MKNFLHYYDEFKKHTYQVHLLIQNLQLHFKNGEVIKLDGYSIYCNRINRSHSIIAILILAPLRVVKNNIFYYSLSILSLILLTSIWSIDTPQYELYFVFSFQLFAHISVELYNKLKINGLDKKLNNQENKILKQWDECISNKEILKRIKQKATTKHRIDDVKERERKISFKNNENLQRQQSQRSRSSGLQSQLSRQSLNQLRVKSPSNQHLDRLERIGSRFSVMSPLILQDMQIKNQQKIKLVQDPAIKGFMEQMPSMFDNNNQKMKKPLENNRGIKNTDKMDLIKSINSSEIQIGDVIIVERNQIAACDILVLYCNDEIYTVQNQLCGFSDKTIRKPLILNKFDSHNLVLFKKSFTGTIQIIESSNSMQGYFQLKKDPQSYIVSDDNFIFAQEKLLNTPWVIGVVIKVGLKCRCYKHFQIKPQVSNYPQNLLLSLVCIQIAFLIIMYIIISQIENIKHYIDIMELIFESLMHLTFLLPNSFSFYYSIAALYQQQMIQKISQLDIKQIKDFHPEQYYNIQRISMNLDSVLDGNFELKSVIYNNQICYCKESELIIQAQERTSSLNSQKLFKTVDSKEDSKPDMLFSNKVQNNQSNTGRYQEDEVISMEDDEDDISGNMPQTIEFRLISNLTNLTQQELNIIVQPISMFERNEYKSKSNNRIQQSIHSRSLRQIALKDGRLDRKSININEMIHSINNKEKHSLALLQLCLNQVSYTKLINSQTGEEKFKNTHVNILDEKQIQIAKSFGCELVCVNKVQNTLTYIFQYNFQIHTFKLIDMQMHRQHQRLYMLFELDSEYEQLVKFPYILFIRESNNKIPEMIDDFRIGLRSLPIIPNQDNEQIHQIHYSYCLFNHQDAESYVNQQATSQSNTLEAEEYIYTSLESLQSNIILGFKYNFKSQAQDFIKNVEKSQQQLLLYTEQYFTFANSILSQTDIQYHNKFVFEQDNEEDLRAYFKRSLQQFSLIFQEQYPMFGSQMHSLKQLSNINPSQLSNKKTSEDFHSTSTIVVILSSQAFKIIENNNYMINHLKLLLSFSKVTLLYDANPSSLEHLQRCFDSPNMTLNLIFENQGLLKSYQGYHLQIALLQEFSYFQQFKYENVNKQTFFNKMIQSLKVRLIYERCLFNELLIFHNSDAILQGFNELNEFLFYYVPLLNILSKYQIRIAFQRTLFFSSFSVTQYIIGVGLFNSKFNFILEFIFYSFINTLIIYILATIKFIQIYNNNKADIHQQRTIESFINISKKQRPYVYFAIKSILQGLLTQLIFAYQSQIQTLDVIIVYTFLSITLHDAINTIINTELIIASSIAYILSFSFYILIHFTIIIPNSQFTFELANIFQILLTISVLQISEQWLQHFAMLQMPDMDGRFQRIYNQFNLYKNESYYRHHFLLTLQREINRVFENFEQVDLNIQKLLLNKKTLSQSLGTWQSQVFQKAQSIMKWRKKSTIQGLQLICFHCQMLIIIYSQFNQTYYYLIIYIVYLIIQVVLFWFQLITKLNSRQLQYLEVVKFMISWAATLIAIMGLSITNMKSLYHFITELLVIFQLSSKLHPIYDNRLYLIPTIVVLIAYFILFIIEIDIAPYFIIINIILILLFSVQQYIVKSYFILLEEDQATNQINFIEENNKIHDILADQYNIHQNQGEVAIVFCDICNFDQIIMEEQENIIQFLDDLFRTFDKYCEICGVQKIETVGKTYMASAGLKACEQELVYLSEIQPVQRALNLAEMMMIYIRSKLWGIKSQPLIGKIGIHYGRAISGVIGFHKPQFSLIGDTVNTTSRVCSTGQEDKITLSEKAFQQLNNDKIEFDVQYVEMKGLGLRPTYIYIQKINNKNPIMKNDLSNNSSKQNTINISNRVKSQSFSRNGLKKRTSVLQDLNQRSRPILQFQQSWNFSQQQQTSQLWQNSQSLTDEQLNIKGLQKQQSNVNLNQFNNFNIGDNENEDKTSLIQVQKIGLMQNLENILQRKFHFEKYQPEVDHYIDYDQLLNVILLKNENGIEETAILESSFIELLKKSYFQNQNNYIEYHDYINQQSQNVTNKIIQIYTLYYLIKQFCLIGDYNVISLPLIILQWIGCALNLISLMIYKKKIISYWIMLIYLELSFQLIIGGLFIIFDLNSFLNYLHIVEMIFIQSFFSNIQLLHFWIKILFCLCSFLLEAGILIFIDENRISIFFVFVAVIYNMNYSYFLEEQQVACFNQKNIFQNQQAKESQLLQYLLPKHILQTFFDDNTRARCLSDKIENVTILFADIAGFTEYSSKVTAEQVLLMLKNLFVEFDRKCYELNVYKLYTIGDCYVAIGMIDFNDRNPSQEAKNIVDLAFEMIRVIEVVRKQIEFDGLDMRIGIHTGCVFGGVMGTDIVRYDIYGPDVLIANKMESNGKKGQVHVSAATKQLLQQDYEDKYSFTYHTKVTLSSINRSIEGFIVKSQIEDQYPSDQIIDQQIQPMHQEH